MIKAPVRNLLLVLLLGSTVVYCGVNKLLIPCRADPVPQAEAQGLNDLSDSPASELVTTPALQCEANYTHLLAGMPQRTGPISAQESDLFGTTTNADKPEKTLHLPGALLNGANLQGVYMIWADLNHAGMNNVNAGGAYLSWANLSYASLKNANLASANMQGANLQHANMENANLNRANMQGANLLWADMGHTDVLGTNLTGTYLTWTNMNGARYSQSTRFPANFQPEKHGMIEVKNRTDKTPDTDAD